jgi:hypothetical protein
VPTSIKEASAWLDFLSEDEITQLHQSFKTTFEQSQIEAAARLINLEEKLQKKFRKPNINELVPSL